MAARPAGGLPRLDAIGLAVRSSRPRARASLSPARVRSLISSRSNSASERREDAEHEAVVVEVGRVVDALGPQGGALQVQRLGAIRL